MRKNLLLPFVIIFLTALFSCKNERDEKTLQNEFVVSVSIRNHNNRIVYLHKFISDRPQIIDSSKITHNYVTFKGYTPYPERYLITIENIFGSKLFVITNDSIQLEVSKEGLVNATISGSKLNTELKNYQRNLKEIYDKIDILFPELQRARLENNPMKLSNIAKKISTIEKEGIEYNFLYAQKNKNSFISSMILNDLSKKDSADVTRVRSIFSQFDDTVKESNDSKELLEFLKTYK